MAELTPRENESNESDEDFEVYFLKPVNEYNIVEKIKEANTVLFEETTNVNEKIANSKAIYIAIDAGADADTASATRKVTFAPNLENYEPENSSLEALKLTREFEEAVAEAKELDRKLTTICAYETIIEETNAIVETTDAETADQSNAQTRTTTELTSPEGAQTPIVEISDIQVTMTKSASEHTKDAEPIAEDDIVEEICEEIIVMDMESDQTKAETQTNSARRMYKLPTFDCAEEDPPELIEGDVDEAERDNKSLVNLMTSDGEEECCSAATFDINIDNSDLDVDDIDPDTYTNNEVNDKLMVNEDEELASVNTSNDVNNTDDYGDDAGDDDLSIIVASYLSDDYEQKRLSGSGRLKSSNKTRHLFSPLSKRFNFRRKPGTLNAIGTAYADNKVAQSGTSGARLRPHIPPPEVTDLKFNYRTCCEYRRQLEQPEKLPKYTGYLSEYGLSRQQLELREEHLQRKQRYVLQQALKVNDAEMRKMQDNERAFTTWLRNKMRFPINKTRNMFDVKRHSLDTSFRGSGACGSSSVVRNASGKRN
ncbi:uncharacterized protein [Eurosta solidaginis]|uniref:uncharacterized protein n=1 Tax=Eurosta solidaginis TaxID=178769 RepID=UPI00353083D8